jgi:hypothetical protein
MAAASHLSGAVSSGLNALGMGEATSPVESASEVTVVPDMVAENDRAHQGIVNMTTLRRSPRPVGPGIRLRRWPCPLDPQPQRT